MQRKPQATDSGKIDALLAKADREEGPIKRFQIVDSFTTFFGIDATVKAKVHRAKGFFLEQWFYYHNRPSTFTTGPFAAD